ncbi:MAG: hypothetical protein LLG97_01245 [Deltaproteobacteria bacterium]|nr:hypothetical protein [Deltaproteobacteria bacterium]
MSSTYFPIIIDAIFFVIIAVLLYQLNKRMARKPETDRTTIAELGKLMQESLESTDLFSRTVQESEERLNKLARQLDNREKRIVILIEKAESLIQQLSAQRSTEELIGSDGEKCAQIVLLVEQGLSREEVARCLKVTLGEIDLVVELERARKAAHHQNLSHDGKNSE